jgi:hypothetical protein
MERARETVSMGKRCPASTLLAAGLGELVSLGQFRIGKEAVQSLLPGNLFDLTPAFVVKFNISPRIGLAGSTEVFLAQIPISNRVARSRFKCLLLAGDPLYRFG